MAPDGLQAIAAAAGDEAAAGPEQRREPAAIEANQGQQQPGDGPWALGRRGRAHWPKGRRGDWVEPESFRANR